MSKKKYNAKDVPLGTMGLQSHEKFLEERMKIYQEKVESSMTNADEKSDKSVV